MTGEAVLSFANDLGATLAYDHGRGVLAVGWLDGQIELWRVAAGQRLATVRHGFSVLSLAFSADGRALASADLDGTVMVWDVAALESGDRAPRG